jgi:beta-glucosidase
VGPFLWGVATSSYQIEGAAEARGPANWDVFAERPGAIYQGHHARVAADHVGRLNQDLDLLRGLGVDAYRFSFSWPRVLPSGSGAPHDSGLAFYDRLIDGLLLRGIEPVATLFHWDLPEELEKQGGFLNAAMPGWFAEYAELLARRYGDRVRRFITLNEPHAFIEGGLRQGRHAPGYQLPLSLVLRAAHHALLAHGKAVDVLRALVPKAWITAAPVLISAIPASESDADQEAAREATFEVGDSLRASAFWMDPLYLGHYPAQTFERFGPDMPHFPSSDFEQITRPLDAIGFNLYDASVVRRGTDGTPERMPWPPGAPRTAFNWPITPLAHYYGPKFCWERYRRPTVVLENGLSTRDWLALDGRVHDAERVDFLERHVRELGRARDDGVPIEGYFHWSFLDNFEWNHGYRERFGLVYVDYETGERTPKQSYYHYRSLIERYRSL